MKCFLILTLILYLDQGSVAMPSVCPLSVCDCPSGQHPETFINPNTGCQDCDCVPTPNCDTRCTKEYDPVCGSDGETYPNRCNFEIAQCKNSNLVEVNCEPCPEPLCVCTGQLQPVFLQSEIGCPQCSCKRCLEPLCVCSAELQPVLLRPEIGCPQCGCVDPVSCPAALCNCGPDFNIEEFVQEDGCTGCRCVPQRLLAPLNIKMDHCYSGCVC